VDSARAKGTHLFKPIQEFIKKETQSQVNIGIVKRIRQDELESARTRQELETEIRKLILRVESGSPLIGKCETCQIFYSKTI